MAKLPTDIEFQLMALVAGRERTGREVAKAYKEETGKSISYGTLYTTFRRLKTRKWVDVRESSDEDGRLRYFILIAEGERALKDSRDRFATLATFGVDLWGKVSV